MDTSIKLVVGLGNSGFEYADTRHNAGVWFVQALAKQHQVSLKLEKKFQGSVAKLTLNNHVCRLFIPETYMNLSGSPLYVIVNFYNILPKEILIAHDELDLPVGVARLKWSGGHAGHNGLNDIFKKLGSRDFYRLRIGIDKPQNRSQKVDYVLHAPDKADRKLIDGAIEKAISVLPLVLNGKIEVAMTALHSQQYNV